MSDTCKGCRYYECRYGNAYTYSDTRHLCWVDTTVVERRRGDSYAAPPACSRREADTP